MYSRINNDESSVGGLILAAGLSTRMGQSKPLTNKVQIALLSASFFRTGYFAILQRLDDIYT